MYQTAAIAHILNRMRFKCHIRLIGPLRRISLMRRIRLIRLISLMGLIAIVWGFPAFPAHAAQFSFFSSEIVGPQCLSCGACTLCDLLSVLTKGMRFLLSLTGALALALFIWGGWELLSSQGKAEQVEHGKKVITGTVVGIAIIVLLAWVWPNWIILALKGMPNGTKPQSIFGGDAWWLTPCKNLQPAVVCAEEKKGKRAFVGTTGLGQCVKPDADGLAVKSADGEWCGDACTGGSPCLCLEGTCTKACYQDSDCADQGLNHCKIRDNEQKAGFCEGVVPGSSCIDDNDCPDYKFTIVEIITKPGGDMSKSKDMKATMVCETITADPSAKECRIDDSDPCQTTPQCRGEGDGYSHVCSNEKKCSAVQTTP